MQLLVLCIYIICVIHKASYRHSTAMGHLCTFVDTAIWRNVSRTSEYICSVCSHCRVDTMRAHTARARSLRVYKNKNNEETVARIVYTIAMLMHDSGLVVCKVVRKNHLYMQSCVRTTDSKLVLSCSSSIYDRFAHTAQPTKHTYNIISDENTQFSRDFFSFIFWIISTFVQ